MSISTHVLDTARGVPAAGIAVVLQRRTADTWATVGEGVTDDDGRIAGFVDAEGTVAGTHRLTFATAPWFAEQDRATFWDDITITFVVADADAHHHVPLLLSPFGYSTYRGS